MLWVMDLELEWPCRCVIFLYWDQVGQSKTFKLPKIRASLSIFVSDSILLWVHNRLSLVLNIFYPNWNFDRNFYPHWSKFHWGTEEVLFCFKVYSANIRYDRHLKHKRKLQPDTWIKREWLSFTFKSIISETLN